MLVKIDIRKINYNTLTKFFSTITCISIYWEKSVSGWKKNSHKKLRIKYFSVYNYIMNLMLKNPILYVKIEPDYKQN